MTDSEGTLDGFVYDNIRFERTHGGLLIDYEDRPKRATGVFLQPHHLNVLRHILTGGEPIWEE